MWYGALTLVSIDHKILRPARCQIPTYQMVPAIMGRTTRQRVTSYLAATLPLEIGHVVPWEVHVWVLRGRTLATMKTVSPLFWPTTLPPDDLTCHPWRLVADITSSWKRIHGWMHRPELCRQDLPSETRLQEPGMGRHDSLWHRVQRRHGLGRV